MAVCCCHKFSVSLPEAIQSPGPMVADCAARLRRVGLALFCSWHTDCSRASGYFVHANTSVAAADSVVAQELHCRLCSRLPLVAFPRGLSLFFCRGLLSLQPVASPAARTGDNLARDMAR